MAIATKSSLPSLTKGDSKISTSKNITTDITKDVFPETISANYKEDYQVDRILGSFKDLAKPNLFKVTFDPPNALGAEIDMKTQLFIKEAVIPSLSVSKVEIKRAGYSVKIPTDTKYGDCTLTFWNDVDYDIRMFFHKWHTLYINNYYVSNQPPREALKSTFKIEQLDVNYNVVYCCKFNHAWPSDIGEIRLSHEDADNRETFTVKLEYSYFDVLKGTS
jgi:hypothetical protein